MNLTDNEILKFQKGSPILLDDICAIYSPTLGEIVDEGYDNFQKYLGILTMTKPIMDHKGDNELVQLMNELTDFQYLLLLTSLDKEVNLTLKNAFRFFTHENIFIIPEQTQIAIGPVEEKHFLTEEKFYELQSILRRMCFLEVEGEEIIFRDDDSPMVRKLKIQMKENREKVRKAKAKQSQHDKNNLKFSDLIGSITINGCGLNMENIWRITYYAFHDQLKRMGWRDQFNINNQAAMAGAKIKKSQLKHWMRSITDDNKS